MFRNSLAARGIEELSQHLVTSIDPAAGVAHLKSGGTMPYGLRSATAGRRLTD
jgi:hypothetical protein